MSMVDRLAGKGTALRDVQVKRWLPFPGGPIRMKVEPGGTPGGTGSGDQVTLLAWREAKDAALSRFEPVATGTLAAAGARPAPLEPLSGDVVPDPYASGELFHGPAFHYLRELRRGASGASAILDAGAGSVPYGNKHQGLLDAITHAIPHDSLHLWSKEIASDLVAYPYRIPRIDFFGPLPTSGEVRVEVRFAGFSQGGAHGLAEFDAQLIGSDGVLVALRLVEILLPKGPIGMAPREQRIAFLRDRRFVPGVALSEVGAPTFAAAAPFGATSGDPSAPKPRPSDALSPASPRSSRVAAALTTATAAGVKQSDWLPGNVARIYGVPDGAELVAQVAVKDHVAARAFAHPSRVDVDGDGAIATVRPLRRHPVTITRAADRVSVVDAGPAVLDIAPVRQWWDKWFGIGHWPVEDVYYGLIERFIGDVVVADPDAYAAVRGRSCLYLANHQVGVESLLFSVLVSGLSQVSTVTLAKAEHRTTWLGKLIQHSFTWPGARDPKVITFFDREDKPSLMRIIGEIAAEMQTVGKSAMVHVEGTRSVTCRKPVEKMSSAFIDMAMAVNAPIVPVRFVGALPVEPLETRLEFPVGYGRQDIWLGRPLLPEELASLPLKERKAFVIGAINGLGPSNDDEAPTAPDPAFGQAVADWVARTGASPEHAAVYCTLAARAEVGSPIQQLLDGALSGELVLTESPEDLWLAELARRLFGPNGPRVRVS
jgi:1-acyl-sn-glycerol-3-phosphate acyltransferase